MIIKVYHQNHADDMFTHVANVTIPDHITDHEEACEYAWRWTQNISGSWSMKDMKHFEDISNDDLNDNVEVVEPLRDGFGHRSSMVGDIMGWSDGWNAFTYKVDMIGFKKM